MRIPRRIRAITEYLSAERVMAIATMNNCQAMSNTAYANKVVKTNAKTFSSVGSRRSLQFIFMSAPSRIRSSSSSSIWSATSAAAVFLPLSSNCDDDDASLSSFKSSLTPQKPSQNLPPFLRPANLGVFLLLSGSCRSSSSGDANSFWESDASLLPSVSISSDCKVSSISRESPSSSSSKSSSSSTLFRPNKSSHHPFLLSSSWRFPFLVSSSSFSLELSPPSVRFDFGASFTLLLLLLSVGSWPLTLAWGRRVCTILQGAGKDTKVERWWWIGDNCNALNAIFYSRHPAFSNWNSESWTGKRKNETLIPCLLTVEAHRLLMFFSFFSLLQSLLFLVFLLLPFSFWDPRHLSASISKRQWVGPTDFCEKIASSLSRNCRELLSHILYSFRVTTPLEGS